VAAAGLAAVAAAQMIGLGEDEVWTFVVELARLWDQGFAVAGFWIVGGHDLFSLISCVGVWECWMCTAGKIEE
jgi:hypothetical protein